MDRASEYRDYAMERGQEVYGAAAETSGDIKVSLKQSASNLKDKANEFVDTASEEWDHLAEELSHSKQILKTEAGNLTDEATAELNHMTEEVKDSADNLDIENNKPDHISEEAEEFLDEISDQY